MIYISVTYIPGFSVIFMVEKKIFSETLWTTGIKVKMTSLLVVYKVLILVMISNLTILLWTIMYSDWLKFKNGSLLSCNLNKIEDAHHHRI